VTRLVLLGASNVRRGMTTIVRTARAGFGPDLEMLGAFGHGRSYGKRSCIPLRCLPGILECGIWQRLALAPSAETSAIIADAGNDILYGERPATILAWVSECIRRLSPARLVVIGLPLARLRLLGRGRFLFFRTILFPAARHSRQQTISAVEELDDGLRRLAAATGASFIEPDPLWYGADPIHIRRRHFGRAWARILGLEPARASIPAREAVRLRLAAPDRRWICGIERHRRQPAITLGGGTTVSLY